MTGAPGAPAATLHGWVLDQARRAPETIAARDANGQLTAADLATGIARGAAILSAQEIAGGCHVGVVASRSRFTAMAMLAVAAAGGAWVPLDPTVPAARLQTVVDAAGISLVLVPDAGDLGEIARLRGVTPLTCDSWATRGTPPSSGSTPSDPDAPAYVLFTSGSTGDPKGVVVPHRAVVNLLTHMAVEPGLRAGGTMLGVTTPAFDLSIPDLFLPLVTGATSVLVPRPDCVDGRALARWFDHVVPDLAQATPSTWRLLLAAGWAGSPRTAVVCGGEAFEAALVHELLDRVGEVWNFYGPTETTVWSVATRLSAATTDPVPLGRPLRRTTCHVLDDAGRPVAPGETGELLIGGDGVALGYLGRPDLTAAAFAVTPTGGRAFRTGDTVRLGHDGVMAFVGRRDDQVKVRGHRVELGDVEAALLRCVGVERAAVVVRDHALTAFVVGAVDGESVRHDVGRRLPDYMVPTAVSVVDRFPLTPNGKLDRRALSAAPATPRDAPDSPASLSPVTAAVVEIWNHVLGLPVGPLDDFFALGGTSLVATRICARVAERLGVDVPVVDLFAHPTPSAVADLVVAALLADVPASSAATVPARRD